MLTEFEATTSSISGIEKKMEKVRESPFASSFYGLLEVKEYMEAVQSQRKNLSHHAEVRSQRLEDPLKSCRHDEILGPRPV